MEGTSDGGGWRERERVGKERMQVSDLPNSCITYLHAEMFNLGE